MDVGQGGDCRRLLNTRKMRNNREERMWRGDGYGLSGHQVPKRRSWTRDPGCRCWKDGPPRQLLSLRQRTQELAHEL